MALSAAPHVMGLVGGGGKQVPEKVIAAAIRVTSGKEKGLYLAKSHYEAFEKAFPKGLSDILDDLPSNVQDDLFYTSRGRLVNREEAFRVMESQLETVDPITKMTRMLGSEDLLQ
jgi:hypothetical protein